jgi:hypothetical protein
VASNIEPVRARGALHLVERSSRYLRTRLNGYFDDSLCGELIAAIDDWRAGRSGVHIFHDLRELEDYDVDARDRISKWCRHQVPFFDGVHVLVQRRTVAWGINIISAVSGLKMTSYHSASAFEDAFARCRSGG